MAYSSDESKNAREIYVQPFPAPSSKVQISSGGGVQPRWRRDGRELFYIADDGKLMAVDIRTAPVFQPGVPHVLFDPHVVGYGSTSAGFSYDVSVDGQRFLVATVGRPQASSPEPITVVLNWQGLKK